METIEFARRIINTKAYLIDLCVRQKFVKKGADIKKNYTHSRRDLRSLRQLLKIAHFEIANPDAPKI